MTRCGSSPRRLPPARRCRLARFNVETGEEDDHLHFSGLPSPAAAASIAGFAILFYELRREGTQLLQYAADIDHVVQAVLPWFAVLVSVLMVSRIPYPHVVNQMFRGQRSFAHLVGLVFALVAIMVIRDISVPIIGCVFVLYSPLNFAWRRLYYRKEYRDPVF